MRKLSSIVLQTISTLISVNRYDEEVVLACVTDYAWFLDGVTVYDMHAKRIYEFPCGKWLSAQNADHRIYRELPMERERGFVGGKCSNDPIQCFF